MSNFEAKTVAILGRQPELGLAELESIYGAEHIEPIAGAALLDIAAGDINFKRLGGTIKIAQILATLPLTNWVGIEEYLIAKVPPHLKAKEGKFTLGLSAYGLKTDARAINQTGLAIKKASARSMRIVPNKEPALNSAQVLHNKLTTRGAWELMLIKDGDQTILAQTFFVQDIEAYGARDQARPYRDARVGMLPPKLAQIIVNLALGDPKKYKSWDEAEGRQRFVVLDPFCGTGVILQEALLMGCSVYGTDLEPRMVEYSTKNLQWLVQQSPSLEGRVVIETADATEASWTGFSTVASETYLGRPLSALPSPDKLSAIVQDVNTINKKFLKNLLPQLKPGRTAALALPAWKTDVGFRSLPLIDELTDMGYNIAKFKHIGKDNLIYHRDGQVVARQIVVITKGKLNE